MFIYSTLPWQPNFAAFYTEQRINPSHFHNFEVSRGDFCESLTNHIMEWAKVIQAKTLDLKIQTASFITFLRQVSCSDDHERRN